MTTGEQQISKQMMSNNITITELFTTRKWIKWRKYETKRQCFTDLTIGNISLYDFFKKTVRRSNRDQEHNRISEQTVSDRVAQCESIISSWITAICIERVWYSENWSFFDEEYKIYAIS